MKNQTGFSMIELVIAVGIMGLSSILTMRLMEGNMSQEALMKYEAEVKQTVNLVQYTLNTPKICGQMLIGKHVGAINVGDDIAGGLKYPVNGGEHVVLQVGDYPTYRVQSIRLANGSLPGGLNVIMNFRAPASGVINKFFASSATIMTETISIVGSKDAAGNVIGCGPVISDANTEAKQRLCTNLNETNSLTTGVAIWDPVNKKCSVQTSSFRCPPDQVPTNMTSLGFYSCIPIAAKINYNHFFDMSSVECPSKNYAIYLNNTNGKFKIGCPSAAEIAHPPVDLVP